MGWRKRYDLIFCMGAACSCTQALRKAGLQWLSFPFDWVGPYGECKAYEEDLPRRVDHIVNDFAGWIRPEDFRLEPHPPAHGLDDYFHTRFELRFVHDFPCGVPLERSFPDVLAKYRHRIARFYELIRASRRILVLRLERPDLAYRTPFEHFRQARERLHAKFPHADFDFLTLRSTSGIPFDARRIERPEPWLTVVDFDYRNPSPDAEAYQPDLNLVGAAIRALVSVKDYRSRAEKRKHAADLRARKLREAGCDNVLQLRLKRFKASVLKRLPTWRGDLMAWHYRRRFAHILPLGVNCEVAFRFYRRWGFLDSSLFAWAQSFDLETLTRALNAFESILAGEATFDPKSLMWKCENTGLFFHGRLKFRVGAPPPGPDDLAKDLADLRGRITHLKRKFLDCLADDGRTLLVHRAVKPDIESGRMGERLDALEAALTRLGARNWELLVVCERADRKAMPENGRRIFRSVSAFNPPNRVTNEKAGDPRGWRAIFSEFAPERILPKKHDFKFE